MISFSIKMNFILSLQLFDFSKGLKNIKTAVVNEPLLALKCLPIISGRLSICAAQMISVEQGAV